MGIAATGLLDQEKGVLIKPTNIPFDLMSLTKPITEELSMRTCSINDCCSHYWATCCTAAMALFENDEEKRE